MGEGMRFRDWAAVAVLSLVLGGLLCLPSALGVAGGGAGSGFGSGSGGYAVAASVNGVEIGEDAVTGYVARLRAARGLEDDSAWADWLSQGGLTPEDLRKSVINGMVVREATRQMAAEEGVTVGSSEVDEAVAETSGAYGSHEEWLAALEAGGSSEAEERENLEVQLLQEKLARKVVPVEVTDNEVLGYAQAYAEDWDGELPEAMDTLDEVPDDLLEAAREGAEDEARQEELAAWVSQWAENADIVVNDMPEGLPYDVEVEG